MTTSTFTGTQLLPYLYGRIDTVTNTARAAIKTSGSGFRMIVTGTDASFTNLTSSSTAPFLVSIDGGAFTTPTLSAGTLVAFSGLTDTTHTVETHLQASYQGGGTYFTLASNSLSVTGSAPSVALDSNYGTTALVAASPNFANTFLIDPLSSNILFGPPLCSGNFYPVPPYPTAYSMTGVNVRFVARTDKIWVFANTNSRYFAVEKDGVRLSPGSPATLTAGIQSLNFGWNLIASGLDDGSAHEWTVVGGGNTGSGCVIDAIMIAGASASFSNTPATRRKAILGSGDSLTCGSDGGGSNSPLGDATLGWTYTLARALGKDGLAVGRPGAATIVGSQQIVNDLNQALRTGADISHVALFWGRNNTDTTTTQTDYTSLLNNILSVPNWTGKVVAITVPMVGAYATAGALVRTGITNAVAAVNSPRVTLVDAAPLTTIPVGTDGTHYTIAGHSQLATFLQNSGAFNASIASKIVA